MPPVWEAKERDARAIAIPQSWRLSGKHQQTLSHSAKIHSSLTTTLLNAFIQQDGLLGISSGLLWPVLCKKNPTNRGPLSLSKCANNRTRTIFPPLFSSNLIVFVLVLVVFGGCLCCEHFHRRSFHWYIHYYHHPQKRRIHSPTVTNPGDGKNRVRIQLPLKREDPIF